jgi:hypothetical protein
LAGAGETTWTDRNNKISKMHFTPPFWQMRHYRLVIKSLSILNNLRIKIKKQQKTEVDFAVS